MERVKAEVKIEDAVILAQVEVKVDIIAELQELAKKTDNTIDDTLIDMIKLARANMDWKGLAKTL